MLRLREAWSGASDARLLASQEALLAALVRRPLVARREVLNCVDSAPGGAPAGQRTVVLAHGFGSGLGFFFRSLEDLPAARGVGRVLAFDWLGMGASERADCRRSPRAPWVPGCDSGFTPAQSVAFFLHPLERWFAANDLRDVTLVAHSLGGYLAARFVLQYPGRVSKLVLASPVGFPRAHAVPLKRSELPGGLRLLDSLWSANVTPQQLVRLMGEKRGKASILRVLRMRVRGLSEQQGALLADYLYQITVARASGEYALNSILAPSAGAGGDVGVFAREPLEALDWESLDAGVAQVKVLFGDHDWMRPNGERSARAVASRLGADRAQVEILRNADHHLYLDNAAEFHAHVLQ
jgi:cardiolipin-specific phospholipase